MIRYSNFSLKSYNTFGLNAKAERFVEVQSELDLIDFLKSKERQDLKLILGGGSNILLTMDIQGCVLHVNLKGKRLIEETASDVIIESAAGENWHEFVLWTIANNWGGIENMSLIPGNIGTAPMQNIGAYGRELKDVFHSLDAIHINTGNKRSFSKSDCAFGYRESVFKNELKGQYIITTVRLKLRKEPHILSLNYGDIKDELERLRVDIPTIKDVSQAVINIRERKLPNPAVIGNSGSFFKNPILDEEIVNELQHNNPLMPVYPAGPGKLKIAAGWLIQQAGWKGFRNGDAGVHKNQALVLVNYGNATGQDILKVAYDVIDSVYKKFGIKLSPEVNII